MSEETKPEPVQLPVQFVGEDEPAVFVNQFALSIEKDDLFIAMAQLVPPIITGPRESWAEQAARLEFVAVRIRGRFAMNVRRAKDLHKLLGEVLANYDAKLDGDGPAAGD